MRWFLQRVELLRERNRLEAIVRAQTAEIHRLRDDKTAAIRDYLRAAGEAAVLRRDLCDANTLLAALGREAAGE